MGDNAANHPYAGETTDHQRSFSIHSWADFDNRSAAHVLRAWQGFFTIDVFPSYGAWLERGEETA